MDTRYNQEHTYPPLSKPELYTSQYNQPRIHSVPIAKPVHNFVTPTTFPNEVDSWIDQLDPAQKNRVRNPTTEGINAEITMAWLIQQSLPRIVIPKFDGALNFMTSYMIRAT